MVSNNHFGLLESDNIPVEEQWAKLKQMRLPIASAVHSGGKSLHVRCFIDAGNDLNLYKERMEKLINYANSFGFDADKNCRNASRLTRLPGALRNGERQYAVCWECGYPDWNTFEECELKSTFAEAKNSAVRDSKRMTISNCHNTDTSDSSTMQKETALLDELKAKYGIPFTSTTKGEVKKLTERFWAAYVMRKHELYKGDGIIWKYDEETGLWNSLECEDLNDIICCTAHDYGTTYGHEDLDSKFDEPHCKRLQGFMRNSKVDLFQSRPKNAIHLANGMVEICDDGTRILKPFSREYYSRNLCPFPYDPKAQCPRFISELLEPVFEQDDINMLQLAFGQAMLAYNLRQKFFILTGTPGGGKGTIVNIIKSIIGSQNCAELRTEFLGNRFETAGYIGKSMLFGNDVPSDFLRCEHADTIKKLTGGDPNDAEIKGVTKKFQIDGHFNMVITSNGRLLVKVDDDLGAWTRRMELLQLIGDPPENPDPLFAEKLLNDEGAVIVNWAIEGAARVLRDGFPKESLSSRRVERLLLESNSIVGFLGTSIERTDSGAGITIGELICEYEQWCRRNEWEPQLDTESKRKLKQGLEMRFHVTESHDIIRKDEVSNETTAMRGYHGVAFKETPPTA